MPYIAASDEEQGTTAATSATAPMPAHQTNDLIFVFAGKDSSPAMTETSASGWNALSIMTDSSSYWGRVWWKRATGSAETAATFTFTLETYHIVTVVVRGAHTSQAPVETLSSADTTIPWVQNQAITTTWANSLVLHGFVSDGGVGPTPEPGVQALFYGDAGANSTGVAWKFYPDASSPVDVRFFGRLNDAAKILTIEIRDDGNNSVVPGYVAESALTWVSQFSNSTADGFFTSLPATLVLSTLGGKTLVYDALGNAVDRGINPYLSTFLNSPPKHPTNLYGAEAVFPSSDWDTGYILSSFTFSLPRDWIDLGLFSHGGTTFTLFDSGNDYRSWMVGAKDSPTTPPDKRVLFACQPAQTVDTRFAASGTFNADAITRLMVAHSSPFGLTLVNYSMLMLSGVSTMAGGTAADPLTFPEIVDAFKNGSSLYPILEVLGSAATVWNPIRFGGVDPFHASVSLRTFQFPKAYDATEKVLNWHVDPDLVGVEFDAQSGDTCKFTNCAFTSDSRYYWRIASTASAGATWSFAGASVAGALVTLRDKFTIDSMIFINSTIDASGSDLLNCTLIEPPDSNNSLTTDGSTTFDDCTIGVLTLSAGNYLCSVANPEIFTGCVFNGSASTGHAIRITTPGTYDIVGNVFNDFGANGTTSAAIYNDSGGSVTINVTGGGSTPTYRNGASASTTVNNAVTVKVTVKDAGTGSPVENVRVFLEESPGGTDIFSSLTNASGEVSTSYNFISTQAVVGRIAKGTLSPYYVAQELSGNITSAGYDVTVFMIRDE